MKAKIRKDFPQKLLNSREEQGCYQAATGQRRNHRDKYPSPPFICSVCSLSHVQLFAAPETATHQAPLSMGFSRQEYWSGLPTSGNLPDSGIKPASLVSLALAGGFHCTMGSPSLSFTSFFFFLVHPIDQVQQEARR